MKTLGICCGASTISIVQMEKTGTETRVVDRVSRTHDGNPKQVVADLLDSRDLESFDRIATTGRKLRHVLNLTSISEPLAIECAVAFVGDRYPKMNAIVSAGGETFIVYKLDGEGRVGKVYTGNKCASGTGAFFLQQIRRMDVGLDEAVRYARSEKPYPVSGRCSVFCKSDCTHATNKGVPKGQVVAGLCRMMAGKVLELLKNIPKQNILLVGGTTRNDVMIEYLREDIEGLRVPDEATYFEAMGTALWAFDNETETVAMEDLFKTHRSPFEYHPALGAFEDHVTFASMDRGEPMDDDRCILGLDVGSTTTKAVLVRQSDRRILASEYLRTNGDPVGASRDCYRALRGQMDGASILIEGVGVTGSGRKIAGLHALTNGVINEIIAHATAAIYFDDEVDTIFEIGGQDAKYTLITNGVASDYAMNEACSAGTGSFLEESAKESLGIEMEEIADWAMKGTAPPNFNDQCAAFISSDIKNASHEGVLKEDVVAGLVYSVCMNYVNRVKGSRPVGKKVFMQGGVCYNRAVPIAMAALSGKKIVVPPEPGLMGAYGVALEVQDRIGQGLMQKAAFSLDALIEREVEYRTPFVCKGGKEKCDIGCEISRVVIEGKVIPFGGACNRYYNLQHHVELEAGTYDLVALRERMVFKDYAADSLPDDAPTVGINRSFLTNSLYPFFSHFFEGLGYKTLLPDEIDAEGVDAHAAPFCFPLEISHGYFLNLLKKQPDHLFVPHIHGLEVENGYTPSKLCPLVQGEPFVLKMAFEKEIGSIPFHTPFLQFNKGAEGVKGPFVKLARKLGAKAATAARAFDKAWAVQKEMERAMRKRGREVLAKIEADPERVGIVLFGRPYNAFSPEANKGIPHKFASRGYDLIPMDFLDLREIKPQDHMYWSMGQIILKGAEIVKRHPQLFGTYITNFSCGPDSFIVGFFRDILGRKPSLTLELDNHTADAGLETRIEAFLDIVDRYRVVEKSGPAVQPSRRPQATSHMVDQQFFITTSSGEEVALNNPRVKLVFPSMSQWLVRGFAAACRKVGVRAEALPAMSEEDLKMGKGNTLCKECLPLQLTTGTLLRYLERRPKGEITVYFMPTTEGPCRFGQYQVFMKKLLEKRGVEDVTFLSLTSDDSYAGLGTEFVILGWYASVIAGCFQNIQNLMLVNALNPKGAIDQLDAIFIDVLLSMETAGWSGVRAALKKAANKLSAIPMKRPVGEVPTVLLVGEIYVRSEGLARRWLPEYLAHQGLATHVAPVHEWVHYTNYQFDKQLNDLSTSRKDRLANKVRWKIMIEAEKDVNNILANTGWHIHRLIDMNQLVDAGGRFISKNLIGEAILTVGGPVAEVGRAFCGSIAIGPFGCMPNRLSESILNRVMDREHLQRAGKDKAIDRITAQMETLPFLAIESDGCPFPQVIEARLETFVLQAKRLHEIMITPDAAPRKSKIPAVGPKALPFNQAERILATP